MAFPSECVGPVCGAFLRRSSKFLSAPDPIIPKIHYSVLTIKLLAEKNKYALHHMAKDVVGQNTVFLKAAFRFMLNDRSQEETLEVTEMLLFFISAIFKHTSIQTEILFQNEIVVREILTSLQLLLTEDTLRKVPNPVIHLMLLTLFQFSSRWSLCPERTQHRALAILQNLLLYTPLKPLASALTKAVLIQVISSTSHQADHTVQVSAEEVTVLLETSSSKVPDLVTIQVLQLLKYLALHIGNKQAFLKHDILGFLAPLVDEDGTQQLAAELLYSLMSPDSTSDGAGSSETILAKYPNTPISVPECITEVLQDMDIADHIRDGEKQDHSASDTVTALLPCAMNCFKSFTVACGDHSQSDASLNLMYTSTLIRMILDVLGQEDDSTQTVVANSIAAVDGAPEAFVHMLWGSSVVLPLDLSQLPPPSWLSTFFEIHNFLVLCTHASELFCLSLSNAGFVHFVECELARLGKVLPKIVEGENQIFRAQILSVLTILYNCVQKKQCLPVFLSTHHLSNYLVSVASALNLEIRFLSKLILGFFSLILTPTQRSTLKLQPDEVMYILSSLIENSQSSEDVGEGFSTNELLQGLLNFSEMKETILVCLDPAIMKCFGIFLNNSKNQSSHPLILQIVWNLLKHTRETHSIQDIIPAIQALPVTFEIKILYDCVTFLLSQKEISPFELLAYARGCFLYQKHEECLASAQHILDLPASNESTVNEAKLLKGKSLYFCYQSMQQIFMRKRGSESIKQIEKLKKDCYEKAREAIVLLGTAQDYGFLDEEGSKLLDCAMIDYLHETNSLNNCQRCLLCRRKKKLRRSHIFPKSILKSIATDLRTEKDHKVFATMIGKIVKKSAGEASFGMLCNDCEQCLSQNGEDQFIKHIHSKICVNQEVVESHLNLAYGGWFYDFCVGLLFRSFAVYHPSEMFGPAGESLYKIFSDCREHLLSLPINTPSQKLREKQSGLMNTTKTLSPLLSPNKSIQFSFFMNPVVNVSAHHLKLEYVLKMPAIFINSICLSKGIYSHDNNPSLILIHFDHMNILVRLQGVPPIALQNTTIKPCGGEIVIPYEYERWQTVPTGVWKLFSALAQASENINIVTGSHGESTNSQKDSQSLESVNRSNLVYAPENIVFLKHSTVLSFLPACYSHELNMDTKKVTLQLPKNHNILTRVVRQWAHEQEMVYFIAESSCSELYLVFILTVPGWYILDGLPLDIYNCTVNLSYLNGKKEEQHPLKLSVIRALVELAPEIREYLHVRTQLS